MSLIFTAVLVLGIIGAVFAVVLYAVAQMFKVVEDPLIDEIVEVLPGANCGGCGMAGCRALAEAFVKQGNMEGLRCTAGGDVVAQKVATLMGCIAEVTDPQVAVVRCAACFDGKSAKSAYEGLQDCSFVNSLYVGVNGCTYGCLGLGSCVKECQFGALTLDPTTGAPVVDEEKCVACGACVKACPRGVIELRNKGMRNRRVYVSCVNMDKGADARQTCTNACIGCGKCAKTCPFGAITIENNLAYIDYKRCKACGKCVSECPMGAIKAVNFTPKAKAATEETSATQTPATKEEK